MAKSGELIQSIPEFGADQSIKIAPNSSVPVTPRLLRLIDSQTFQRLRKIRQLSLADQVFPSATHTRFSHALGVYNNILAYLKHLDRFPEFHEVFQAEDYLAIMLAGLLHDVGHYPYSHQLDHLSRFPKHEKLTVALIQGETRFEHENLGQLIWELFRIEPAAVARLLGHQKDLPPRLSLLKQIIDSPIDADKCDYLPRDSYYCGVDYGTGFDRERFIHNLVPSRGRLCIHEKGLLSAERFQLARYWMYRSVYWGHTVRALITMLSRACAYLAEEDLGKTWEQQLMSFNDHNFLDWIHGQVDPRGKELIEMVHQRRQPYKRLYTVSYLHQPQNYLKLQQEEGRRRILDWFHQWLAKRGAGAADHHLIWDVPPFYKTGNWESFPIKLAMGGDVPIANESPVINALSEAFLHGVRKIRLFIHPKYAELLRRNQAELPRIEELI